MTLNEWLAAKGLNLSEFSRIIGVSPTQGWKYSRGQCSPKIFATIEAVTGGEVTCLTFHPEIRAAFKKVTASDIAASRAGPPGPKPKKDSKPK